MAKRKAAKRPKPAKSRQKGPAASRSAKRPTAKRPAKRQASAKKKAPARKSAKKTTARAVTRKTAAPPKRKTARARNATVPSGKVARLDRARRTLPDAETHTTPPSSLDMNQHGSAARTGRAGMEHDLENHNGMSPDITGGDVDVDVEDAYFTGDEAPGGDNPTPDQDIVEDIGKALGVTYNDNEELEGADKVEKRDKHRWEMDPASSEDYKERK